LEFRRRLKNLPTYRLCGFGISWSEEMLHLL
jgi:hypothetical protein